MTHARLGLTLMGLSVLISAASCSTDTRGLGQTDAGRAGAGGRAGSGSGGAATGGRAATGATGGTAVGGSGGVVSATGGTVGSGGVSGTGGSASGGTGTGGVATGGKIGSGGSGGSGGNVTGTGGTASGGRGGSGGAATGGAGTGGATTGGRNGSGGAATGGAATGGAATGGRGTGGAGTGGRGTGGTNGTGGQGGNEAPTPECMDASDCKLQSDCCTCAAVPENAPPAPVCAMVCIQSRCAALMLPQGAVACVAGRCIAGFNCDDSRISCNVAPPVCVAGEVPGVNPSGACYSGNCVPASQCKTVPGCTVCGGAAPACVTYQTQTGNQHHCVTIPPVCGDDASCDCLGPSSCVAPYRSCQNYSGIRGISCSCPNC